MDQRNTSFLSDTPSTRRRFLKDSATAGVAIATGFAARDTLAAQGSELAPGQCPFSAMAKDFTYLNSGTEGSMSACVVSTFQQGLEKWAADPTASYETDPVFGKHQVKNRE
jgi:hypothetical protein